jgi:hypothetical protein
MALIGLLLLLATGTFAAGVMYSGDASTTLVVFGADGREINLGMLFLLGAITGITFAIGLGLFFTGLGRRRVRRAEVRAAEARKAEEAEALRARNDELERKVDLTRNAERRRAELNADRDVADSTYDAYPDEPELADDTLTDDTTTVGGRHRRR